MKKIILAIIFSSALMSANSQDHGDSTLVKKKRPYYHNMVASFSISQINLCGILLALLRQIDLQQLAASTLT